MGRGARGAADLAALVAKAYESALTPLPFADFLPDITAALEADGAAIALYAPELGLGDLPVSYRVPESAQRRYNEHYWKIDPWRIEYQRRRMAGAVAGTSLISFRDLARTEIYNDHLREADYFDTCCAEFYRSGSAGGAITVLRAKGRAFYGPREVARLNRVVPHLKRAFALHRRFAGLIAERAALAGLIDRVHGGVVLCQGAGSVVYASVEAQCLLDAADVLFLVRGCLHARDAAADAVLAARFKAKATPLDRATATSTIVARDRDGRAALRLSVIRAVSGTILDARGTGLTCYVLIDDLAAPKADAIDRVAARHRLTPAEARLARCLAAGATLGDAAAQLGVSVNTVRSQLQQIFQKTGVSRQAQLMRILLAEGGH